MESLKKILRSINTVFWRRLACFFLAGMIFLTQTELVRASESVNAKVAEAETEAAEPEAEAEAASMGEDRLQDLIALLEELPDPEGYLADGTADESILDRDQLAQARAAAEEWLVLETETASGSEEAQEKLESLLVRLEGLEHIRDTETDCMDLDCLYHYPEVIKKRMTENEIPELLTLEELVEDYGVEPPAEEAAAVRNEDAAMTISAVYSLRAAAAMSETHPQTLMFTDDNENNSHTGQPDGDIDVSMSQSSGTHPIEISFTLDELPTQSAYLAVKAYDVDEDSGETDYVYLNDDIYLDKDKANSYSKPYNDSTIGYLSGTNNTWNTTVLEIPLDKLVKGKNVISITVASGWVVTVDWMQLVLDGGEADSNIEEFALKLEDAAANDSNVTVQSLVTVKQKGNTAYATEYVLTQNDTGNALDACFGKTADSETIGLTMPLTSPSGVYTITGILKDAETEMIKATDSISFYFLTGVGMGPKISHTLTPDVLTNQDVAIQVSAEAVPEVGITDITLSETSRTVTENGSYSFNVSYKLNGEAKSVIYTVKVDNIDREDPAIVYTPIAVQEDEDPAKVKELFAEALSVSDNRKLASEPLTYTIPEDISKTSGVKTVTVTAADAAGNTVTKDCIITVAADPSCLTLGTLTPVSGSKDSYTLQAVLTHIGVGTITETGFVWGVIPEPTLDLNNGSVKTSSVVMTKGGTLTATATGLLSGVEYYARAYAKVTAADGISKVVYSDAGKFGFGIPAYGTFSVSSVSGSTFTITRTGGTDGEQTIYYRTVNGSAIGGTHFTHQAGTITFADGEANKTVTVTELGVSKAYNSDAGTQYCNADRTYSLEIYRVEGGGTIEQNNRLKTRTMAKSSSYTIDRTVYTTEKTMTQVAAVSSTNGKRVADTTSAQGGTDTNVRFLTNRYKETNYYTSSTFFDYYTSTNQAAYLNATASGWYYRYVLRAYENKDGYEHAYIGTSTLEDIHYGLSSSSAAVSGVSGQLWACNFQQGQGDAVGAYYFPDTRTGGGENSYKPKNSFGSCTTYNNQTYVDLQLGNTCYCYFGATGSSEDIWYVDGLTSYALVYDENEPLLLGAAPMAGGTYLPGDPITVALVFDEIVDGTNSTLGNVSITTNVGTLAYAGGADTNVLYFAGTVDSAVSLSGSSALKITAVNNISGIKDMCSLAGGTAAFTSGSTNVIVDITEPTVTITPVTSGSLPRHQATVTATNAETIQYAWTKSTALPTYGWQNITNGTTLTEGCGTAGATEIWYLHVLAVSASGAAVHFYQSFSFKQPTITEVSVRASASGTSTDVADVWKPYKYIVVKYAGTQTSGTMLTIDGPATSAQTITAGSGTKYLKVTENGTYTVTLTDAYGSVVSRTIEVKKIDTQKPTVTLRSSSTDTGTVYHSLNIAVFPEDTGGSGAAKVEYTWNNTTSTPSSWSTLTAAADGSYQAEYTATETIKTEKYLHVRVTDGAGNVSAVVHSGPYQVIQAATGTALPEIAVTGNPVAWAKSTVLTWTAVKGTGTVAGEIKAVYTPDGEVKDSVTGTCTVTKNGLYQFTVTDECGNSATREVLVTKLDNEAPKLSSLAAVGGKAGTITLTGVTDDCTAVYNSSGLLECYDGSGIQTRQYRMEGESTWTTFTGDSFTVTKNGTYIVSLTDRVGNSREYRVEMTDIDATAPRVTCTINAAPNAKSGWYTTANLPVILTFADEAGTEGGTPSGIQSVQYKWVTSNTTAPTSGLTSANSSVMESGTVTRTLGSQGVWYLYYKVTDKKGNVTAGFSDEIKKDTYSTSCTITGPDKGQPVSSGLEMTCTVTYGPSGGRVTGGLTAASAALLDTFDQSTGTGSRSTPVTYTAKSTGTNYFRFYKYAANGADGTSSWNNWDFYVRQITFNSQGGSAVESQLVWDRNNTTAYSTVTEPEVPTRTGYTFGGWYTDAACTDGNEFDFNAQVRANTTLYAKWTANTYSVAYHLILPDGTAYTPEDGAAAYTYGQGLTLPVLTQEGFVFCGWYDNADYSGISYTSIGKTETGNREYYAYFKDTWLPTISVSGEGYLAGEDGWWRNALSGQVYIRMAYADNVKVTELWVKADDGEFAPKAAPSLANGTFDYTDMQEGEHTYTFKAVDAAGNEATASVTVKLDVTKPEIGTITCEQKAANILDWLIGRESLILHIPVADSGSGVKTLTYTETPAGGMAETKTVSLSGNAGEQMVDLKLDADWKGSITDITCTDTAGNVSDSKSIEGAGNGIIVEDNPPVITITEADLSDTANPKPGSAVSENYYDESDAPTLYVAVADEAADETAGSAGITAGIQSITYTINGSTAVNVTGDFTTALTGSCGFTIALSGKTGNVNVSVKSSDYAGNTASASVIVKIKRQEAAPVAEPDYQKDALANLVPGASYEITIPDGESHVTYPITADENGEIPFVITDGGNEKIELCGKTIDIVRKGDGTNTTDSEPQMALTIKARPDALDPNDSNQIHVIPEIAKDADDARIEISIDIGNGIDGTDREYSTDGGITWTDVPEDHIIRDLAPGDVIIRNKADEDKPHGEEATVTIPESANTITAVFDLNYEGADSATAPDDQTDLSYTAPLIKPADPQREGYDFAGWYRTAACEDADLWDFENTEKNAVGNIINKEAPDYTLENNIITVRLYAKWRENVKPGLRAELTDEKAAENWYSALSITLTYSDNKGVTELYAKRDNGDYTQLNLESSTAGTADENGNTQYQLIFSGLEEGAHTYTFKAVDAAGNVTETDALTAKLDTVNPVLGEAFFNEGYKNLWDWIIRKESLIITVPVTEAGSGIKTVEYALISADGQTGETGSSTGTATVEEVSGGSADYTAKISIDSDFKGKIEITGRDSAGNASLTKTIGTDGSGIKGVIVEDNAPVITILADRGTADDTSTKPDGVTLSTDYYNTAPKLLVKVKDDDNSAVTGGLASVSWKIGDEEKQNVGGDFQLSLRTEYSFTISVLEGKTGSLVVTVKAEDQAGNRTSETVTVLVKEREAVPKPSVDYQQEKLTGLVPDAAYVIGEENIAADTQGCIAIREDWFGSDIQIRKKGGTGTLDSGSADVEIAARPEAPSVTKTDETIKGKRDTALAGVSTAMEYSVNSGETWTFINGSNITDGCITGLAPGEIWIREKATLSVPHGEPAIVTIEEGRALTVTFESNGGSGIAPIYGRSWEDIVDKPEDPVKEGYTFAGWYQESTLQTLWYFASETEADKLTEDITLYAKWTLEKPSVTLTADGGTADAGTGEIKAVYNNGNPVLTLKAELSNEAGSASGITYTYEWYRDNAELEVTDGTAGSLVLKTVAQSGTYQVKITAKDRAGQTSEAFSGNVTVNIEKATPEVVTKPSASAITYGQTLEESVISGGIVRAASMAVSDVKVTVTGSFSWTSGNTAPKVADSKVTEYTVTFIPRDAANYKSVTTTLTLQVNRKSLKPSVAFVQNKTYDGTCAATGTLALAGAVTGEQPEASGTFTFTDGNAGNNKQVNVTDITLSGNWGNNYVLLSSSLTAQNTVAEITPRAVGLSWSGDTDLIYTGTPVNIKAIATGVIPGDICEVMVTDGTETNAGTYTAVAVLSNANYCLPETATHTYTIEKVPITFLVSYNIHTYDNTEKGATVEQAEGETLRIAASDYTVRYMQNGSIIEKPTDAGTYDVMVTLQNNKNYKHAGQADSDSVQEQKVGELMIHKKQVKAVWTDLSAEYNGTLQAPTCTALVGLLEADAGQDDAGQKYVWADFTGEQRLTDAGTKRLTAALGGTRADNYQLTNADVNFAVQKAPVIFTVTDNMALEDGLSHKAAVSASVNGVPLDAVDLNGNPVYAITYRNAGGETVEEPTKAGVYAVYAELTNLNYRHSGTANGMACQIGVLTIYQNQTPRTYTVKYASGAEDASEVTGDLPAEQNGISPGTLIYLPGKGALSRTDYAFTGWRLNGKLYRPGETIIMPAKDVTITAGWKESTYSIGGVVDQEGNVVQHAVVTLMRGAEKVSETRTDENGTYSFTGMTPGLYNLITAYNGITTTVKVLVEDTDAEENITLPAGRTSSILEVMAGTPAVIVGNLEKLFRIEEESGSPAYPDIYTETDKDVVETGGAVEIRLTVKEIDELGQTEAELLKETMQKLPAAYNYQTELYLDVTLQKTVYPAVEGISAAADPVTVTLSDSQVLLETVISLPSNLQNRRFYKVYRLHENVLDDIVVEELTAQPNAEGEYYELNPEKTELTIHARKYSLYSVAASDYVEPQPAKPENSGGSGGHSDTGLPEETIPLPAAGEKAKNSQTEERLNEEMKESGEDDAETEKLAGYEEDALTEDGRSEERMTNEKAGKPLILLNVLLTLLSLVMAALVLLSRKEKKHKIAGAAAAAASLLLLLLTWGFDGVRLADLRTMLFAVLAGLPAVLSMTGENKEDKKEKG